jgi:hypothetical protein
LRAPRRLLAVLFADWNEGVAFGRIDYAGRLQAANAQLRELVEEPAENGRRLGVWAWLEVTLACAKGIARAVQCAVCEDDGFWRFTFGLIDPVKVIRCALVLDQVEVEPRARALFGATARCPYRRGRTGAWVLVRIDAATATSKFGSFYKSAFKGLGGRLLPWAASFLLSRGGPACQLTRLGEHDLALARA